jgi:hypothetical protein
MIAWHEDFGQPLWTLDFGLWAAGEARAEVRKPGSVAARDDSRRIAHMADRLWPEAVFLIGQCQIRTPELPAIGRMLYAMCARVAGVGLRAGARAMTPWRQPVRVNRRPTLTPAE